MFQTPYFNNSKGQGEGQGHDFCPQAVLEVEDSPRGPHLYLTTLKYGV